MRNPFARLKSLFVRPRSSGVARMRNGKIEPPYSCELIAAYQCNISCSHCNQASPIRKKGYPDAETVYRDFSRMARIYHARFAKIVGGEPLLHPDFAHVVRALRRSGISEQILLLTNGMLLDRMPEETWRLIDRIEVSVYPETPVDAAMIERMCRQADALGVTIKFVAFDHFRVSFSRPGTDDDNLIRRIYRTCKMAHVWGCQVIHNGHFHKCVQSIHVPAVIGAPPESAQRDGIRISDSPDLQDRIRRYLYSDEPLHACRHCLGVAGRIEAHRLVERGNWLAEHEEASEALIDFDTLRRLEEGLESELGGGRVIAENNAR